MRIKTFLYIWIYSKIIFFFKKGPLEELNINLYFFDCPILHDYRRVKTL